MDHLKNGDGGGEKQDWIQRLSQRAVKDDSTWAMSKGEGRKANWLNYLEDKISQDLILVYIYREEIRIHSHSLIEVFIDYILYSRTVFR